MTETARQRINRILQTQIECYWRACHALNQPVLSEQTRLSAVIMLRHTALRGASLRLRLHAIRSLNQHGLAAPAVIGSGDGAA